MDTGGIEIAIQNLGKDQIKEEEGVRVCIYASVCGSLPSKGHELAVPANGGSIFPWAM